jgi:hypothetical protein
LNQFKVWRFRDLTIMDYPHKKLVISCDSCGAIGPKPLDKVQVSAYLLGRFLARTALMEVISVGAQPIAMIDPLSVEMKPTGEEIIRGIRSEAAEIKLNTDAFFNGSTEDNIATCQTGAGIVVIGETNELKNESFRGDHVLCIGLPKVGEEVRLDDEEICNLPTIKFLRERKEVHEIVPVGSKGIFYEISSLLERNQISIEWSNNSGIPMMKSAGPSTCVIVTVAHEGIEWLKSIRQPIHLLGKLSQC